MSLEPLLLTAADPDGGTLVFDAVSAGPADGAPTLLLHGWPETAACWHAVQPALADAGLHTVAVTQRGYSPGARPEGVASYDLAHLAGDVPRILDALGWDDAHVVAHDWGAAVAWAVAAAEPGRVRSLTAVSIPHPRAFAAALQSSATQRERSAYMDLLRAPGGIAESVLLRDDGAALRGVFTGAVPDDVVTRYVEAFREPGAMSAILAWYRAMDAEEWARVGAVDVPTTYVWGTRDAGVSADAAELCGGHVHGDYDFVVLEGAGHWLPSERSDDVVAAVLRRVGRPAD